MKNKKFTLLLIIAIILIVIVIIIFIASLFSEDKKSGNTPIVENVTTTSMEAELRSLRRKRVNRGRQSKVLDSVIHFGGTGLCICAC